MSVRVYVRMSKIMGMPIKVGICMYMLYANCQTMSHNNKSVLLLMIETQHITLIAYSFYLCMH